MRRWLAGLAALVGMSGLAAAQPCTGRDLIAALPEAERAVLSAAVDPVPYARGLLWQATKGPARMVLAGTYHFGDARHAALVARLEPEIAAAATLFVEAGPEEERTLSAALARDPTLMAAPDGPTLAERLAPEEWRALSAAMSARGLPAVVTSRLRPWYVATMLSLSPCMLKQAAGTGDTGGGLDHLLTTLAARKGTPVKALEPWDTLFRIFSGLSEAEELDMIRSALPAAAQADDHATTLLNAYFAGEVWLIWEFGRHELLSAPGMTRAEVDAQMRLTQERLMDRRNRAWVPVLTRAAEAAAARGKGIVAAFGALHLPGEAGVLRLLEAEGWTVVPLPAPG